jgi:predicted CoA-binding protein
MKQTIDAFLADKNLALVGASPNKDNFARGIMEELKKLEYNVVPVNPNYDEVAGVPTVAHVTDLPENIKNVVIMVHPEVTPEIARQCVASGVERVWIHKGVGKGSYSEVAVRLLKENSVEVVYGFCPMMFFGKGFHRFHLQLRKVFGKVPPEYSMN